MPLCADTHTGLTWPLLRRCRPNLVPISFAGLPVLRLVFVFERIHYKQRLSQKQRYGQIWCCRTADAPVRRHPHGLTWPSLGRC
jgi:hypothetical protein